jgi:hypothetical protein
MGARTAVEAGAEAHRVFGPGAALVAWAAMLLTTPIAGAVVRSWQFPGRDASEYAAVLMMVTAGPFGFGAVALYWAMFAALAKCGRQLTSKRWTAPAGACLAVPAGLVILSVGNAMWGHDSTWRFLARGLSYGFPPPGAIPFFVGLVVGGATFGFVYATLRRDALTCGQETPAAV